MEKELNPKLKTAMTIFMLVVLGAIIGWIYEMLFYRIDMGHFIRRGQGGPWLPIYGFGALGLTLATYKKRPGPGIVFLITCVGAFIIEFGTGWFLYHFMDGLRLWDYNTEIWNWGNIGGYVCARSILIFGVFGVLYAKWAIPGFFKLKDKIKDRTFLTIVIPVAIVFLSDIVFSYMLKPLFFK